MTREELIAAMQQTAGEKPTAVKVKGWGTLYIRSLTVAEVEQQADDTADKKDKDRIARAAARVICDESGKRLLDPDNEKDVALLSSQPWTMLRKVLSASGTDTGDDSGN